MIGTVINDRYRIEVEIGAGGMGIVYQGFDLVLKRPVAVKVLLARSGMETQSKTRLLSEAQTIAQLDHPNIVTVYDAGETDYAPFIVMQQVSGISLRQIGNLNLTQILEIIRQLCQALQHAHNLNIVHRDLKPENILLTNLPSEIPIDSNSQSVDLSAQDLVFTVMLMDFGMARSEDLSTLSQDRAFLGTIAYLSPEQALGNPIDNRSDLYSLGVILYELVAERLPFTAEDPIAMISQHLHAPVVPPSAYNEEVPAILDTLIMRLLSKEPDRRPASAEEILQLIEGLFVVHPSSLSAPSLSPLERLVRGQMVGRERELSEAIRQWNKVQTGESAVLLISGEPGIGKTRMVREIVAYAKVSGAKTLSGECYPEGNYPYAPIAQIIETAIGSNGHLTTLEKELPNLVIADLLTLAPTLSFHLPVVPPNPPLDPLAEQQRLFESMVHFCRTLTTHTPVLLVLEDAHWADHGTLALLRHIARRAARLNLRLLLVLTYREVELARQLALNEVLADFHRERLAERIKLSRLTREQTRDMLAVLFQEEITPELLEGIYHETEGNPFFIEEVCKALIDEGKIYREGGSWQRLAMTEIHIPQSVRLAIERRVRYLPTEVREPLVQAAIFGRIFEFNSLVAAIDIDEYALMDTLEQAERAQLITETEATHGGTFSFTHALIPNTLTGELSGLRRRRMHQRAAKALQELQPENFEALAHHYAEAAADEKACHFYTQAGHRARSHYANEDAIQYYSLALELMERKDQERFDLLAARADVYELTAQRESHYTDVEAMLKLAEDLNDNNLLLNALIALADYYLATDHIRSQDPLARALSLASELNDLQSQAKILLRKGETSRRLFDFISARHDLEKAIAIFQEKDQHTEEAACLLSLISVYRELGDIAPSLTAGEQAIEISKITGDSRQEADAYLRLGGTYLFLEEYVKARTYCEECLALFQEIGDIGGECNALNTLAISYVEQFNLTKAEEYYLKSLEMAEAISFSQVIGFVNWNLLISVYLPRGEHEVGLIFLRENQQKVELTKDQFLLSMIQMWQIIALNYLGQFESALKISLSLLSESKELFGQSGYTTLLVYTSYLYLLCKQEDEANAYKEKVLKLIETLDADEPRLAVINKLLAKSEFLIGGKDIIIQGLDHINDAITFDTKINDISPLADDLTIHAQLFLALFEIEGDPIYLEQALDSSTKAIQLAEKYIAACHLDEYCYTHAQVLIALGRQDEAEPYLRKAFDRVMQVADNTQDEELRRSWLENVPIHQEILIEAQARGWM
jgi:serine/threonine protein kinase/tetratricopeptide (TPR) repeat protein